MPKRLLRGVIDFGDNRISADSMQVNFRRLVLSGFEWHNPDERKLYEFVKEYFQENREAPSEAIIRDIFERRNELTVTEKLLDVKAVEVYVRTHYETLLKDLLNEQKLNKFRRLLQDVDEIAAKGRIVEKQTLRGINDAVQHLHQHILEAIPQDSNARTEGDVVRETQQVWEEYQEAKLSKNKVYGRFTGIDKIDTTCHGIKRGELWIHAAAPGELKTTFALNWAYNLVTRYRSNVFYVSLEMPYMQLRRLITTIHTANGVFMAQGRQPLDYRKIRDGELSPDEEQFYKEALDEFGNNSDYEHLEVWAPDRDVTIADIRIQAEMYHRTREIGLLVIDHGGLVKSSRPHKDYTIELNSVLRESKKLALHFNNGEGVPVLMLFQINRAGQESVAKQEGKDTEGLYRMAHLAYANEAERSADYITTTYLNDRLRKEGATIMANLKNRDNDLFQLSKVRVDFGCRRMRNWDVQDQVDIGHTELSQEDLDLINNG